MPGCRWITLEELTDRRAEWHALVSTSAFPSAFGDPAWILAWWRHYGEHHDPWLYVLEDREGSLRGLAPLALRHSSLTRTLTFAGDTWNGLETLLCAPGAEPELNASLLQALADRCCEWDLWRIQRLRTDSALAHTLLAGGGALRAMARDLRLQPFIELPADADTFESRFPGKRRNEYRRRWRKLLDLGAQAHLITDAAESQAKVAAIVEMRRDWAIANGQSHAHMDARFERFIVDAIRDCSPDGVRLWTLELDGKILTAKLNFLAGQREHGYLSALSDELLSLSPGHALERHVILAMIAEGRREFDFGPGRDSYKYRWGAVDRELARIVVSSPSLRGRLLGMPAAIDLRLRDTAAAEALRTRKGMIPERDTARLPRQGAQR